MYLRIRNTLLTTLTLQLALLSFIITTRVVVPLVVMTISIMVLFFFEGLFYEIGRERRIIAPRLKAGSWYQDTTREWRRKQRAKAKKKYMDALKKRGEEK